MSTRFNNRVQLKPVPGPELRGRGMGFLWFDDYDAYFESGGGGDSFWDRIGPDGDYVGGGGGGYDYVYLPFVSTPDPFSYFPTPGIFDSHEPYIPRWYETETGFVFENPEFVFPFSPGNTSSGWNWDSFWESVRNVLAPGPTPSLDWQGPLPGDVTEPNLPIPCYGPTYHPYPIGHPQQDLCVPYPPGNTDAQKKAKQQQQKAAQAARAAQQKQDQSCPKDPQGRPVWRNPQTGKCELVPPCPPNSNTKFDPVTRHCLTPQQYKEIYGEDYSWLWWVGGGVLLLALTRKRR